MSAIPIGRTSNRFMLIPAAGMKSVILNMISLTVVTIAEIVPDNSDLRVAGAGIAAGRYNQLAIRGLGGAVLVKDISGRSIDLPFL
ncbi:hypothetical protein [Gimesia panareensis]|uniref:hypothetical protein n=1 Tax=Gimesia panareensis TaxID=2527978 RepID=UPI0011A4A1D9|nr:hypothetical protein [Gimesia panareensis]